MTPVYRHAADASTTAVLDMDLNGTRVWIYRVFGPGLDEVLGEWHSVGGQITYNLRDALGSITAVTTTQGVVGYRQTYRAFGEMTRGAAGSLRTTRFGYTGRENSIGGYSQYRTRYYDTATGRFTQQDSYRGNAASPPSMHRYTYVLNNPIRYTDPLGMIPWGEVAIIAAEIALRAVTVFALMGVLTMFTAGALATAGEYLIAFISMLIIGFRIANFVGSMGFPYGCVYAPFAALLFFGWSAGLFYAVRLGHAILHHTYKKHGAVWAMIAGATYSVAIGLLNIGLEVMLHTEGEHDPPQPDEEGEDGSDVAKLKMKHYFRREMRIG